MENITEYQVNADVSLFGSVIQGSRRELRKIDHGIFLMSEVAELTFPDVNINRHGIMPTFPLQTQEELKNSLATSA